MKFFPSGLAAPALFLVLALGLGCNRTTPPPTPFTPEELPGAMENAFSTAKPQAKELAALVVTSVKGKDFARAFSTIQALVAEPGLTKEQVNVASRATITVSALLQEAGAQGDAKAAAAVKLYRETK
jgi:hypothetical protein